MANARLHLMTYSGSRTCVPISSTSQSWTYSQAFFISGMPWSPWLLQLAGPAVASPIILWPGRAPGEVRRPGRQPMRSVNQAKVLLNRTRATGATPGRAAALQLPLATRFACATSFLLLLDAFALGRVGSRRNKVLFSITESRTRASEQGGSFRLDRDLPALAASRPREMPPLLLR